MVALPVDLEVERVLNLIRGFGWEMKEKRIEDNRVSLSIQKSIEVPKKE